MLRERQTDRQTDKKMQVERDLDRQTGRETQHTQTHKGIIMNARIYGSPCQPLQSPTELYIP